MDISKWTFRFGSRQEEEEEEEEERRESGGTEIERCSGRSEDERLSER